VPLQSTAASPPPARPFSDPAPIARSRAVPGPRGSASPGVLVPTNARRRVPRFPSGRPLGRTDGTRVAIPSSVPSSGFLPLSTVLARSRLARTLAGSPFAVAPTFRGLVPCRSRPWNHPSELSPPEEPCPLSRAAASLRVRPPTAAGAAPPGASRSLSPPRPPVARGPPEGERRTHEQGRQFPAIARPVVSTRPEARLRRPTLSHRHWARRLTAGTPASKPCSPRESVPSRPHSLARARSLGRCSLGFRPSRALSTTVQGPVSRADTRGRAKPCTSCAAGHSAVSLRSRDPSSDAWIREPRIRRHAGSIEPRAPPSGGDPAQPRFASAAAPATSPTRPSLSVRGALPVPPLGGTPRLPALHGVSPRGRPTAGPRRRFL
jgi:hypothetical protein